MNQPTPDPPSTPLLRIPEVAERLQISRQIVYKLIAEGHLKATNISRSPRSRLRVSEDHLAEFVKAGQDHGTRPEATVL